ncbi:MAG TPA: hypothetical protein V6C78_21100 [Crinalium sp.]|jgi:hypothetical protein
MSHFPKDLATPAILAMNSRDEIGGESVYLGQIDPQPTSVLLS